MESINKPLLATLALALLSLAAYQTYQLISLRSSTQVLGDTTAPKILPPPGTGIPCEVVQQLEQKYCSSLLFQDQLNNPQ